MRVGTGRVKPFLDAARAAGQPKFSTPFPCIRGHMAPRDTIGGQCEACKREYKAKWLAEQPKAPERFTAAEDAMIRRADAMHLTAKTIARQLQEEFGWHHEAWCVLYRRRQLRERSPTGDGEMGRRLSPMSDVSSRMPTTPAGAALETASDSGGIFR